MRIHTDKEKLFYVGRTGDSSSPNAAAPYARFGQHLGSNKNANALRRNLEKLGLCLDDIRAYDFVFYGPIFPETKDCKVYNPRRDSVAALEKQLAESLTKADYTVLNKVKCRKPLNQEQWNKVKRAFLAEFPKLGD